MPGRSLPIVSLWTTAPTASCSARVLTLWSRDREAASRPASPASRPRWEPRPARHGDAVGVCPRMTAPIDRRAYACASTVGTEPDVVPFSGGMRRGTTGQGGWNDRRNEPVMDRECP